MMNLSAMTLEELAHAYANAHDECREVHALADRAREVALAASPEYQSLAKQAGERSERVNLVRTEIALRRPAEADAGSLSFDYARARITYGAPSRSWTLPAADARALWFSNRPVAEAIGVRESSAPGRLTLTVRPAPVDVYLEAAAERAEWDAGVLDGPSFADPDERT